jgi:peptide deformylase
MKLDLRSKSYHRLSINPEIPENGKEGRKTQEGCPAPIKSEDFRTFSKF